jgi:hypothetical protein
MGVRITDREHVALYDSTTDTAFGPIFDSMAQAEDFLNYIRKGYENEATFRYGGEEILYLSDPRIYRPDELDHLFKLWQEDWARHEEMEESRGEWPGDRGGI